MLQSDSRDQQNVRIFPVDVFVCQRKVSKPIWLVCQLRYSVAGHVNKTVDTGLTILIASSTKL